MTDVSIPTKSARRAANRINLVFLILTALVYKAIVYKVVSVEPIIVELINPIKESTPKLFIISVAIAIEALPEIGRRTARGSISAGTFNRLRIGRAKFVIASIIPEERRILIDKNKPNKVGKMFITICIPSLAPSKKISKTDCFSIMP